MLVRCVKCGDAIGPSSAFAVRLYLRAGAIAYDIKRTSALREHEVVMHVNGDRSCGKPISGFKTDLLRSLGVTIDSDLSFLDTV